MSIDDLIDLTNQAEKSSQEAKKASETRGGTPVENRIAQALVDTNAALAGIVQELSEIKDSLKNINTNNENIKQLITNTDDKIIEAQSKATYNYIKHIETEAQSVRQSIEKIGIEQEGATKNYLEAVEASVKRIRAATAASALVLAFMSVLGGLLAFIGAWWLFQAIPGLQSFIEEVGWQTFIAILTGIALVIWLGYCIWSRVRR